MAQRGRAALRLPVRAPPNPEGDARTRSAAADNFLGGCGRAVGDECGQRLDGQHLEFDRDASSDDVDDPLDNDSRRRRREHHDPTRGSERARAGSGRQSSRDSRASAARRLVRPSHGGLGPARSVPPRSAGAPAQPGRRPSSAPRRPSTAAAAPGTRPRQRPHRPPAKVSRLPLSRQRRGWENGTFTRRVRLIRFILLAAILLVVARLIDVQVLHSGAYQAAARGESSISVSLSSLRGGIYDRDGSPLAVSVPTDDVVADDYQVAHPVKTALALSPILHVPAATLAAELHRPTGYVVLARQLPRPSGRRSRRTRSPASR